MEAIKSWEFEEAYSEQKAKISLFNDRVEMMNSYYKKPRIFNFNEIFEINYPLGNLQVDYELLKYMVIIVNYEQLSEQAKLVYNFYKTFENNAIEECCIENNTKKGDSVRNFSSITKFGIRNFYERDGQSIDQNNQRFSAFFFYGPEVPNLDLSLRKTWRGIIWNSLGKYSLVQKNQAFLLFDYSKIKLHKFEYNNPYKNEGAYLYINQGDVQIGGWSGRDGGGQTHSIEKIWYFDSLIYSEFEFHKAEIRKTLEAAIIHEQDSTITLYEPNAAPPA